MPTKQTIVGRIYLKDHPEHAIFVCLELGVVQTWSVFYCGRNETEINSLLKKKFGQGVINSTREIAEANDIEALNTRGVLSFIQTLWQIESAGTRGPRPNADTALALFRIIEEVEEKIWKENSNF